MTERYVQLRQLSSAAMAATRMMSGTGIAGGVGIRNCVRVCEVRLDQASLRDRVVGQMTSVVAAARVGLLRSTTSRSDPSDYGWRDRCDAFLGVGSVVTGVAVCWWLPGGYST